LALRGELDRAATGLADRPAGGVWWDLAVVEAVGVEPAPQNANWLMARDFALARWACRNTLGSPPHTRIRSLRARQTAESLGRVLRPPLPASARLCPPLPTDRLEHMLDGSFL